jgi:hypothetical protein
MQNNPLFADGKGNLDLKSGRGLENYPLQRMPRRVAACAEADNATKPATARVRIIMLFMGKLRWGAVAPSRCYLYRYAGPTTFVGLLLGIYAGNRATVYGIGI